MALAPLMIIAWSSSTFFPMPASPTGKFALFYWIWNSPYQSFSSFAGNPYLISQAISDHGLLDPAILEDLSTLPKSIVDYGALFNAKWPILNAIYNTYIKNSAIELPYGDFDEFCSQEASWLEPFAFPSSKSHFKGLPTPVAREIQRLRQGHKSAHN